MTFTKQFKTMTINKLKRLLDIQTVDMYYTENDEFVVVLDNITMISKDNTFRAESCSSNLLAAKIVRYYKQLVSGKESCKFKLKEA